MLKGGSACTGPAVGLLACMSVARQNTVPLVQAANSIKDLRNPSVKAWANPLTALVWVQRPTKLAH